MIRKTIRERSTIHLKSLKMPGGFDINTRPRAEQSKWYYTHYSFVGGKSIKKLESARSANAKLYTTVPKHGGMATREDSTV
jgi:hypothetical protein